MNITLNQLADIVLKYYPDRNRILVKNKILENKTCYLHTKNKDLHEETVQLLTNYENVLINDRVLDPEPPRMGNVVIVGNRKETEYDINITIDYETFIK